MRRGAQTGAESASGWCADLQCRDRAGRPRGGDDEKSGFGDVLLVEGARRTRRLDGGRIESVHREGTDLPKDVWRRDAAGWSDCGGGIDCAREIARAAVR